MNSLISLVLVLTYVNFLKIDETLARLEDLKEFLNYKNKEDSDNDK